MFWHLQVEPLGQFPSFVVCMHKMAHHLYSRFHLDLFRFVGVITEPPSIPDTQSECVRNSSSLQQEALQMYRDHAINI